MDSEPVEKDPKQILGREAEKNDLTECATINDLTMMRGYETPKNHPLIILKSFSTASAEIDLSRKRFDPLALSVAFTTK